MVNLVLICCCTAPSSDMDGITFYVLFICHGLCLAACSTSWGIGMPLTLILEVKFSGLQPFVDFFSSFICHVFCLATCSTWHAPYPHPRGKIFWLTIPNGIFWDIWKERNRRIFEGSAKPLPEVIDAITFEVASWAMASPEFKGLSISDISSLF